jgi:nicotinate-nucleotide pyrophosphorylase (carboxylating)
MMLKRRLEEFIEEDLGYDDVSCTLVPDKVQKAVIFTKEDCILAGTAVAGEILDYCGIRYTQHSGDGNSLNAGAVIFEIEAGAVSLLRAERLTLNFLSHLSGIATLTRRCVNEAGGKVRIAATRKTMPGLRRYEKMAVVAGGGDPHRFSLSDCVMIKDNHRSIMGLENAIRAAQEKAGFTRKIEAEVESSADALLAAKTGADIIMLDNMDPAGITETLALLQAENLRGKVTIEISGGVTPENLKEYACLGADVISMSSLIHGARWIDISLEMKQ